MNDIKPATKIWIHIQREPQAVGEMAPVVQSCVDFILRGCLTTSEDFANAEFISTTKGWHPSRFLIEGDSDCDETDAETSGAEFGENEAGWVDDRSAPIHMRADPK
jgi:hypothetical protein